MTSGQRALVCRRLICAAPAYAVLLSLIGITLALSDIWSTAYCPTDGCIAKCQHLTHKDHAADTLTVYWCGTRKGFLFGDLNNDGLCDIICVKPLYAHIDVKYRQGSGFKTPAMAADPYGLISATFCNAPNGAMSFIMDVNADGYDDIMCVFDDILNDDKVRGYYIAGRATHLAYPAAVVYIGELSSSDIAQYGNQTLTDKALFKAGPCTKYNGQCSHITAKFPVAHLLYDHDHGWCDPAVDGSKRLYSGDLNNDGYCDLVCHDARSTTYVMLYNADIRRYIEPFWISEKYGKLGRFCNLYTNYFTVMDLDQDGRAEMICGASADPASDPYMITTTKYHDNGPFIAHDGVPGYIEIMASDVFNLEGNDTPIACSASVNVTAVSVSGTNNPCENVTRNAAYLQANRSTVMDSAVGAFCKDPSASKFISADVDGNGYCDMICQNNDSPVTSVYVQYLQLDGMTYETRHNQPSGTSGLGINFACDALGALFSMDGNADGRWDLFCNTMNTTLVCGTTQIWFTYWYSLNTGSGLSPNTAPLSKLMMPDLTPGGQTCQVLNTVDCDSFSVANGMVMYDAFQTQFEITCNLGYELKGNHRVGCVPGPFYDAAFPICREINSAQAYDVAMGQSIVPSVPTFKFLSTAFEAFDVVTSGTRVDCIRACSLNVRCISAIMDGSNCHLFAFQAKREHFGGDLVVIIPVIYT